MRRLTARLLRLVLLALALGLLASACGDDVAADPDADEFYALPATLPDGYTYRLALQADADTFETFGGRVTISDGATVVTITTLWPGRWPDDVVADRQPDNWVTIDGREFNVFFHAPTTDVAWPLTSGTDASVTADLAWPAEDDPPPLIRELMASIEPVDRDRWRAVTDDLPAPSTP